MTQEDTESKPLNQDDQSLEEIKSEAVENKTLNFFGESNNDINASKIGKVIFQGANITHFESEEGLHFDFKPYSAPSEIEYFLDESYLAECIKVLSESHLLFHSCLDNFINYTLEVQLAKSSAFKDHSVYRLVINSSTNLQSIVSRIIRFKKQKELLKMLIIIDIDVQNIDFSEQLRRSLHITLDQLTTIGADLIFPLFSEKSKILEQYFNYCYKHFNYFTEYEKRMGFRTGLLKEVWNRLNESSEISYSELDFYREIQSLEEIEIDNLPARIESLKIKPEFFANLFKKGRTHRFVLFVATFFPRTSPSEFQNLIKFLIYQEDSELSDSRAKEIEDELLELDTILKDCGLHSYRDTGTIIYDFRSPRYLDTCREFLFSQQTSFTDRNARSLIREKDLFGNSLSLTSKLKIIDFIPQLAMGFDSFFGFPLKKNLFSHLENYDKQLNVKRSCFTPLQRLNKMLKIRFNAIVKTNLSGIFKFDKLDFEGLSIPLVRDWVSKASWRAELLQESFKYPFKGYKHESVVAEIRAFKYEIEKQVTTAKEEIDRAISNYWKALDLFYKLVSKSTDSTDFESGFHETLKELPSINSSSSVLVDLVNLLSIRLGLDSWPIYHDEFRSEDKKRIRASQNGIQELFTRNISVYFEMLQIVLTNLKNTTERGKELSIELKYLHGSVLMHLYSLLDDKYPCDSIALTQFIEYIYEHQEYTKFELEIVTILNYSKNQQPAFGIFDLEFSESEVFVHVIDQVYYGLTRFNHCLSTRNDQWSSSFQSCLNDNLNRTSKQRLLKAVRLRRKDLLKKASTKSLVKERESLLKFARKLKNK